MKKFIIILFFFLLFSNISYGNEIKYEEVLGKKCEVNSFNTDGEINIGYLSNYGIFLVTKKNENWKEGDWSSDKNKDYYYINGNLYNKHEPIYDENIKFYNNGKNYYGVFEKENGKKVLIIDGKESSEFDEITKIDSYFLDENKSPDIFKGKKSNGEIIYIINGQEIKKDFYIKKYFKINGKLIYVANKNEKDFIVDKEGNSSEKYDYIIELRTSEKKDSYSFIGYNNNDKNYIIVKDSIEIKKIKKDYTLCSWYSVFGLNYNNNDISFFVEEDEKKFNHFVYSNGKFENKGQYLNIDNFNNIYRIDNSIDREYLINHNDSDTLVSNQICGIIGNKVVGENINGKKIFIYSSGSGYTLEDGYKFNKIYENTNGEYYYIIENEKKEQFLIIDNNKFGPFKEVFFLDHSLKSNKVVFGGKKHNGKQVIIFDGKEGKEYDAIYLNGEVDNSAGEFTPDGKNYSYVAANKGVAGGIYVSILVKEGKEDKMYPNIYYDKPGIDDLTYSPDGEVLAYKLYNDEGIIIGQNGKESESYINVEIENYDKNNKSFGLFAQKKNGNWTYVDNFIEVGEYNDFSYTFLSPQKDIFGFVTSDQKDIIRNGIPLGKNNIKKLLNDSYSNDGKSYIFSFEDINGTYKINLDGVDSKGFKNIQSAGFLGNIDYLGFIKVLDNDKYFGFISDNKYYKCLYKEEKLLNKIFGNSFNNEKGLINENNYYKYIIILVLSILFIIGGVIFIIRRKK